LPQDTKLHQFLISSFSVFVQTHRDIQMVPNALFSFAKHNWHTGN